MPATREQYLQQRPAIRGNGNPQPMDVPLWIELVHTGETAYAVASRFGDEEVDRPAGWCFDRFGMSRTRLTDGTVVCIGGEHEGGGDPNFFIYNDAILINPDGAVEIFGYSPDIFAPTDFHTATLVGDAIYIVGGLGYFGQRGRRSTPVYRLDLRTMRIRAVTTGGDEPGWVFEHRAELAPDGRTIRIAGGKVIALDERGKEDKHHLEGVYCFDTIAETWSRGEGEVPTLPIGEADIAFPGWSRLKNRKEAHEQRSRIARAVRPGHPLFGEDYWPMAEEEELPMRIVLQMLDGTGRWVICNEPTFIERTNPSSCEVTFYDSLHAVVKAVGGME